MVILFGVIISSAQTYGFGLDSTINFISDFLNDTVDRSYGGLSKSSIRMDAPYERGDPIAFGSFNGGTAGSVDGKNFDYKMYLGYSLTERYAVELHLADFDETTRIATNDGKVDFSVKSYGISGVFKYPINPVVSPFVKMGFHRWSSELLARNTRDRENDKGTDTMLGIGFNLFLTDRLDLRAEYEYLLGKDWDMKILSLGVVWDF